ncbi:MAG TPA: M23 family metallopeptidase [Bacteroidota bacterium]
MEGEAVREGGESAAAFDTTFRPVWPTSASKRINSSFAEFRRTHFHSGLDISTNNRTGYPVYATQNGYVSFLEVSPSGYGKVLYVRHPNGYSSVYAHLSTFNEFLNAVAEELQQRTGKYAVGHRFEPGDVVVQQGDTLGYTGDTGTGSAHLHFEIRDENFNPLNPLMFPDLEPRDDIPPTVRRIAVSPLNASSTVDGGYTTKVFSVKQSKKHLYEVTSAIEASGDIGLSVETWDQMNGSWRTVGVNRIELYIDSRRIFVCEYDRIQRKNSKQVALHFDWPLLEERRGRFRKLYVEPGDGLKWYQPDRPRAGVLSSSDFEPGPHQFRILCYDMNGNSSETRGKLVLDQRPELQRAEIRSPIAVTFDRPDLVAKLVVSGRSFSQKRWTAKTHVRTSVDRTETPWVVPPQRKSFDVLKIVAEDRWGTRSDPYYFYLRKPKGENRSITIEKEFVRDFVAVTITTDGHFTEVPILQVYQSGTVQQLAVRAKSEGEYFAAFRPLDALSGPLRLQVRAEVNGVEREAENSFELYAVVPGKDTTKIYDDGTVTVTALPDATYETVFLRVEKEENSELSRYVIQPDDQLLNAGIRISFRASDQLKHFDKLGVYTRLGKRLQFLSSEKDSSTRTVTSKLDRTLGEVALLEDLDPPGVRNVRILTAPHPQISFSLVDDRSGVDAETIEMYIDGNLVIPRYEEETHMVTFSPNQKFGKGTHTLSISVRDRVGNRAAITKTFRSSS